MANKWETRDPGEFIVSFTSRFCWSESCRICSAVSFSAENIHLACCCAALKSLSSRHEEWQRGRERLGGGRMRNISMNTVLQAGLNLMSITRRLQGSDCLLDRWRPHSEMQQGDQVDVWRMESFSCGHIGSKLIPNKQICCKITLPNSPPLSKKNRCKSLRPK